LPVYNPNVNREHDLGDKVADKTIIDWTIEWWKWLLSKSDEENPFTVVGPARPHRYIAGQPNELQQQAMKEYGESVWFVAGAPYAEPESTIRIPIPAGRWSILASSANVIACPEMFPSLKTLQELQKHVQKDAAGTYELYTLLDGFSLNGCVVDLTDEIVEVDSGILPPKNMMNINKKNSSDTTLHTIQYGIWVWIRPLASGDHLLRLHGYSRFYKLDTQYQLDVTGP
jgi:hypothetical protein